MKEKTNLYLDDELKARLAAYAKARGRSLSAQVEMWIQKYAREKK